MSKEINYKPTRWVIGQAVLSPAYRRRIYEDFEGAIGEIPDAEGAIDPGHKATLYALSRDPIIRLILMCLGRRESRLRANGTAPQPQGRPWQP